MSEMGVRNLSGFNKKVAEAKLDGKPLFDPLIEDEETELEELPSIVVVVDEFADMMMLVGKKVEHLIARIAQKASFLCNSSNKMLNFFANQHHHICELIHHYNDRWKFFQFSFFILYKRIK